MGYRLEIVNTGETPYDDPITLAGMDRLVYAAQIAGIDLKTKKSRTWEKWEGKKRKRVPIRASLEVALTSNDGWFITPEETAALAKVLPDVASDSEDPQFIREMATFFSVAAKHGGVFVF